MTSDSQAPRDALADALGELREDYTVEPGEPADRYWLRVGLRLGLQRPGRAQLLLERLEGGATARAETPGDAGATPSEPAAASPAEPASRGADPDAIPVRSLLLARAAMLALTEPPETVFGWASRLTADEITRMGRIVEDQVQGGAMRDLTRGFGLTWTAGVRVPHSELNELFARFTDLELTVAGVLAGHDVRESSLRSKSSISDTVQRWFLPKASPGADEAAAIFEGAGEAAQRGLIAVWNVWAAMRYRSSMPAPTFELLIRPWVAVVGRLPEP